MMIKAIPLMIALMSVSTFAMGDSGAGNDSNEVHSGKVKLALNKIVAKQPNGDPYPAKDSVCQNIYKVYQGMEVEVIYDINTKTNIMEASMTFTLKSGKKTAILHPLGVGSKYIFSGEIVHNIKESFSGDFTIDKNFKNPSVSILFKVEPNLGFTCVASSE